MKILFARAEPRPGHEGVEDWPCCRYASLDCGCGGTSEWHPCDCESCIGVLMRKEYKLRKLFVELYSLNMLKLVEQIARDGGAYSNYRGGRESLVCNFCGGQGTWTPTWIKHTDGCPQKILAHESDTLQNRVWSAKSVILDLIYKHREKQ